MKLGRLAERRAVDLRVISDMGWPTVEPGEFEGAAFRVIP
jgi:hypothetical protein